MVPFPSAAAGCGIHNTCVLVPSESHVFLDVNRERWGLWHPTGKKKTQSECYLPTVSLSASMRASSGIPWSPSNSRTELSQSRAMHTLTALQCFQSVIPQQGPAPVAPISHHSHTDRLSPERRLARNGFSHVNTSVHITCLISFPQSPSLSRCVPCPAQDWLHTLTAWSSSVPHSVLE